MGNLNDLLEFNNVWRQVQQKAGVPNPKDLQFSFQAVIDAPLNLFVATTGNDGNPGTVDRPFLTPQAAINSISNSTIASLVTISVGIGTFPGFNASNLKFSQINGNPVGLTISGTLVPGVLSTGANFGTFTAINGAGIWSILTDSTQSWTVNELRGKYIRLAAFSSQPPIDVGLIMANTSTTITLNSGNNPGLTGYTIIEQGTTLQASSLVPGNSRLQSVSTATTCILLGNDNPVSQNSLLYLSRFNLDGTFGAVSNSAVRVAGPGTFFIEQCNFVNGATSAKVTLTTLQSSSLTIQGSYFNCPGTGAAVSVANSSPSYITLAASYIKAVGTGPGITSTSASTITSATNVFDTCTTGIVITAPAQVGPGSGFNVFLNNTTNYALSGTVNAVLIQTVTATIPDSGNTNGIVLTKGARCQVASTVTVGATNELTLDGAVSTLATMRAASPKLLTNTYGTIVYE